MSSNDYARVQTAIQFLTEHAREQPSLARLAAHMRLSPHHAQRVFRRWAGVTPKDFVQAVTLRRAKEELSRSRDVLSTSIALGLSGPSRLHDLFVTHDAMTPGQFKRRGAGVLIEYGVYTTALGPTLVALTARGICGVSFLEGGECETAALDELRSRWPDASFHENRSRTERVAAEMRSRMRGAARAPLCVVLRGTAFQVKVWQALLAVPPGARVSYTGLSSMAGVTGARAVGSAVAENPIAYLVPCHRVIRSTGSIGEYRWGATRKRALLALEAAHLPPDGGAPIGG